MNLRGGASASSTANAGESARAGLSPFSSNFLQTANFLTDVVEMAGGKYPDKRNFFSYNSNVSVIYLLNGLCTATRTFPLI